MSDDTHTTVNNQNTFPSLVSMATTTHLGGRLCRRAGVAALGTGCEVGLGPLPTKSAWGGCGHGAVVCMKRLWIRGGCGQEAVVGTER